jgi:hypothetical protein
MKKTWVEFSIVFALWGITYMLFPSIVIQKDMNLFTDDDWNIFMIIFACNFGDIAGRIAVSSIK